MRVARRPAFGALVLPVLSLPLGILVLCAPPEPALEVPTRTPQRSQVGVQPHEPLAEPAQRRERAAGAARWRRSRVVRRRGVGEGRELRGDEPDEQEVRVPVGLPIRAKLAVSARQRMGDGRRADGERVHLGLREPRQVDGVLERERVERELCAELAERAPVEA